jgi:hypothetical protein
MRSALPALESVIGAGIRVLIYNGDAVRPLLFLPLLVECGWCLPGDVGLHRELPGCRGHGASLSLLPLTLSRSNFLSFRPLTLLVL